MFAKKSLGQNFLMHRQTAERIVAASGVPAGSLVLEIGPGTGMLTRELLQAGYRVLAVEADDALAPELEEAFADAVSGGSLTVLHADIRNFDANSIHEPYHVIANIPYYITGEIIRQFLTAPHQPRSMTLLVQKEVAERVARDPKGSILSLSIRAFGTPSYAFTVPRGAFRPAPNVDSAVLVISDIGREGFSRKEEEQFFAVLKAGFAHKRKRLLKNLEERWGRDAVLRAAEQLSIPTDIRAEELEFPIWRALAKNLAS